jgi:hypothetical protein
MIHLFRKVHLQSGVRGFFLLFLLVVFLEVTAQQSNEQKYALITNSGAMGVSLLSLTDPYLSPLTYTGLGVRYDGDSRRYVDPENENLSWTKRSNFALGMALNPANSSSMVFLGANAGWGMHYHFRPMKGLKLLAGGMCDIDFGMKQVSRNVNNPFNFDLSTNLNLSGVAMYDIPLRRRTLRLNGSIESPLLGCMFVPRSGASYYEIFDLWNLESTMHFSSLHNKRGLIETFTVDVPFNRSTWRFGFRISNLKYQANDIIFKRNEASLLIGIKYDVATFAGKKNRASVNFISTDKGSYE